MMKAATPRAATLPERLNDHAQGLFSQVHQAICNYRESYDREAIHDLRVAIKRLRLFYMLAETRTTGLSRLPDFAPIQRLFRKAGGLRDIHIQLELINSWKQIGRNRLDELLNEWKRSEKKKRAAFLRTCKGFRESDFKKIARQVAVACKSFAEQQLRGSIWETFRLHYSRLLVFPPNGDRHRLRTNIKNARYAIELLALGNLRIKALRRIDRHLQQIQKPLGRWHDVLVGLQWMDRFLMDTIQVPLAATKEYRDYQKHLRCLLRAQLGEYRGHWNAFLADPAAREFLLSLPASEDAMERRLPGRAPSGRCSR